MRKMLMVVLMSVISLALNFQVEAALHYGLSFTSDPGSYVGNGQSFDSAKLTDYNIGITNYGDNALHANVRWTDTAGPHQWSLDLSAPDNVRLESGLTYEGATRWPFQAPGVPGISIAGEGRCANAYWGTFRILDVEYTQWGYPGTIAVDFAIFDTRSYTGGDPNPLTGLYGEFRYNTEVPFSPVPLPAAAWLLGSGMIGLVGIRTVVRNNK